MDKLLKGRRPFRTKVTKLIGEIVTALDVQPPDTNAVQVLHQMLEDSFVKVQQWDQQIAELMVEENAYDNDQDKEF